MEVHVPHALVLEIAGQDWAGGGVDASFEDEDCGGVMAEELDGSEGEVFEVVPALAKEPSAALMHSVTSVHAFFVQSVAPTSAGSL